ncbi:hypothetical protein ABT56_12280 [Photobacterium aquae]|uniref:Uncharacterized protein n=1 Tax=Photobacterium aquae TaxID=1195763 RepID=A0A0J1H077_9GAMM|nr:hypothetical protein [Photobacterium aquae]KLV05238.1 hypothetical protein ABT56_12280 [Photobacterium aquae]
MKKLILIICLMLPCVAFASNNQLHLSKGLNVNYDEPKSLVHSGDLLIFKYDDWYFSHELVDAKNYYQPVDLTDVDVDFFQSLFFIEKRKQLPEWLSLISSELSSSFGIKNDNKDVKKLDQMTVLGAYSNEYGQGNIFIIDGSQIHHININGLEANYKNVFNSIMSK